MSRPRRLASQKVVEKLKLDLSEDEEEESDGDFSSQSSDEYRPDASNEINNDEEIESDDVASENEEAVSSEDESPKKNTWNSRTKKSFKNNKNRIATLRKEAINRFNSPSSQKLQDILKKAQFGNVKPKSMFSQSESDEDDGQVPNFDCSAGLKLSDSSDSENDSNEKPVRKVKASQKKATNPIDNINDNSGKSEMDLKAIHDNLERMKKAREKLSNYNKQYDANEMTNDDNIASLLAMGENSKKSSATQKRKKASQAEDSDSDNWEDVEEDESKSYAGPKEGVEIMLNSFGEQSTRKDAKPVDVEAQLKRKFNRKRKEHQEYLHKTELMCWLSHYNHVNSALNNPLLMQQALEMLPTTKNKNQCYPKDKTDIDYFTQITKWFKQTISLRNTKMYCDLKKRPSLLTSLALQMKYKTAICRRDYILMFIALLRAIGIQCRMVQSVVADPKICPKSELMSLSKKNDTKTSKTTKTSSKSKSKSSDKNAKSSKPNLKLPQLDGADNDIEPKNQKPKRAIRIKGPSDYKVDDSYVDLNSMNSETPKSLPKIGITAQMSPKVQIALSSSNQNKSSSLAEKLKKNSQHTKSIKLMSPRKTRSASREASPKIIGTNKSKADENGQTKSTRVDELKKKSTLQVFSPRRLRSRSRSTDGQNKSLNLTVKQQLSSKAAQNKSVDAGSTKRKVDEIKKSSTLQVFSPRRLRSRSRSTDPDQNKSANLTLKQRLNSKAEQNKSMEHPITKHDLSNKKNKSMNVKTKPNLNDKASKQSSTLHNADESKSKEAKASDVMRNRSRKREATTKNDDSSDSKKPKIVVHQQTLRESRKRTATLKDDSSSSSKKMKKELEDDFSDDSLKYFRDISSSSSNNKKVIKKPASKKEASTSRNIDRRILSSDDEDTATAQGGSSPSKKASGIDIWVEVYSEKDEKWICIDVHRAKVDCIKEICQKATHPLVYVFAFNNDKSVKDVAARYVPNLNTTVRKMRVDREYLKPIMDIFNQNFVRTSRDFKEDEELNKVQFDVPMPKSIAEFKNHPLYVLKRHLLKYQAIYPPEPPILGYIRDEAIYPRDCCFTCHSRETWLKEARVVKLNEQPYKIVKTLRWDRATNKLHKDIPLEVFGIWQTKDFEPPVAENGIVPRNAYGNVELFKPCMLPIGTVHLQLPGLNKVCKKLGVDCSQAIVGFDSNGGWPFPVYDGYVICKEFEEKVIDAWNKEQDEAEQREREKYEKRVYGNWKKLIKGLLIRERLLQKYNNFEDKN